MAEESKPEGWSWKKFFGGFFNGVNTAKSIVTTFHQILVLVIVLSVGFLGWKTYKHFHKPKPEVRPIEVTNNSGTVHSSVDDNKKKFGLINVF